jgi:hypothetical protein
VKSSFTILNILVDKRVVQNFIMGDNRNYLGEAQAGLHKTVRKRIKEDSMSIVKPFFEIEWFKTRWKKLVHFKTDRVSVLRKIQFHR